MLALKITFQFDAIFMSLVAILAILSGIFFYRLLSGSISSKRWWTLISLRIAAIVLLLILLFKPAIEFHTKPIRNSVPIILIDDSRSMEFADTNGISRIEYVKKLLIENQDLLEQKPQAKIFTFADNLKPISIRNIRNIAVRGKSTDITAAIEQMAERNEREKIQAVIVLTDGQHLGSDSPISAVSAINQPIYWLGVGSQNPRSKAGNLAIDLIDPPIKIATGGENFFTADVRKSGSSAITANLEVTVNKQIAAEKTISFTSKGNRRNVDVAVQPSSSGKAKLKFQLTSKGNEYINSDNFRYWHCLSLPEKIKMLIVEPQVSPEYKFLKQYLQSDPAVEFVSMVQIRPGKFLVTKQMPNFTGRSLPASKADFQKFDLFILGNISRRTFDESQAAILKQIVEEGKGILFIAGDNLSDLAKTPLNPLLPIRITQKVQWFEQRFLPKLTLAGKASDILKGCGKFFDPHSRFANLAKVDGWFFAGQATPASTVLMESPTGQPCLAIKPIGKGKSALLCLVGTWRWALNPDVNIREKLYRVFWGQLIRNVSGKELKGKQKPVAIVNLSTNSAKTGESIKIIGYVFNESADAITSAKVSAELLRDEKKIKSIKLAQRDDHFESELSIDKPGNYKIRFKAEYVSYKLIDEMPINVYRIDKEFTQVALNKKLLDELARTSGTEKMQPADSFGEILSKLRKQYAQQIAHQSETHQIRLFDYRVFLMIAFVIIVTSEWLLRYKWGLR